MQENNENKLKYLEQSTKWLNRYKRFFQLDDDDIQEISIKFWNYYVPGKGTSPDTFTKIIVDHHNAQKWKKQASPKYNAIEIQLDKVDGSYSDDRVNWLEELISGNNRNEYLDELDYEDKQNYVKQLLSKLKPKELDIIMKFYFEHKSEQEIANEYNTSRNVINEIKRRGLNRMKKDGKK